MTSQEEITEEREKALYFKPFKDTFFLDTLHFILHWVPQIMYPSQGRQLIHNQVCQTPWLMLQTRGSQPFHLMATQRK